MIPQKKKKKNTHTPPPPCRLCGKKFARKQYLEIHVNNVHKGLKEEISCKFCDKSYTHFSNLCRHIRKEHKDKQFPLVQNNSDTIGENSEVGLLYNNFNFKIQILISQKNYFTTSSSLYFRMKNYKSMMQKI